MGERERGREGERERVREGARGGGEREIEIDIEADKHRKAVTKRQLRARVPTREGGVEARLLELVGELIHFRLQAIAARAPSVSVEATVPPT